MKTNGLALVASVVTIVSLLSPGCAPTAVPTPTSKPEAVSSTQQASAATVTEPTATPKTATEQRAYGGTLTIGHRGDPASFDPIQETDVQSVWLVVPCYSGIVQHDPLKPTEVIGDLAEKWEMSQDGMAYTFHLYKNVKWHDGTPFTAEDARFSLEVVRKPPKGVNSPRQEWLKAVEKVEAPDKDTLRIALQYPSASFLHNLGDGRMVIVPRHVWEAKGSMKKDVMGTGPYKFKSFALGSSSSVVKNPDYFMKGRPYLDGVTWYIIPDAATRFAALRTHRIQVTPFAVAGLTPSQAETVRKEMSDKIAVDRSPTLVFIAFWMPHTKAPWSDIRVRRAIDLTIDRPKLIKAACEGVAEVGRFMPTDAWGLSEDELMKMPGYRQPKDADIAEAKRLMAEAGYGQGIKTTTMTRQDIGQMQRAAVILKEQLAQIGIDLTVSLQQNTVMYDLLFKRNYDTAVFSGSTSYDDPDQVFGQQFVSGVTRNFSDFSDEKIDKWYDEQTRILEPTKRKQVVLDMQRRMHELIPCVMLYWQVFELGRWKEVKDFRAGVGSYNNLKLQDVWLAR